MVYHYELSLWFNKASEAGTLLRLSLLDEDCFPSECESLRVDEMTSLYVTNPLSFLEPISATV